jgi:hypothetical protein
MQSVVLGAAALVTLIMVLILTWAVLSTRVRDGIVIKLGLSLQVLAWLPMLRLQASGAEVVDMVTLSRLLLLANVGFAVVAGGLWWRKRCGAVLDDLIDMPGTGRPCVRPHPVGAADAEPGTAP